MFAYDKTFDPKVVLGQYDLISRFSDFPLYLGTQLVYGHTAFTIQYKPGGFLFSHLTQWRGLRVGSRDFSIFSTHRGGLLISA